MSKLLAAAALVLATAVFTPSPARAMDIGLRAGLEAPLVAHASGGSYNIGDSIQPALNVMLTANPNSVLAFDAEFIEGFAATGTGYRRTGTSLGPGITLSPPLLPIYARASLPIHLEPGDINFGLRAAGGLSFNLVVVHLYLEGIVDLPIAGGGHSLFDTQTFSLGAGAQVRF